MPKFIPQQQYLDATIHIYLEGKKDFKKFRNIKNQESRLQKFEHFARTFPGADYVNYYWHELPHDFAFRRYLTEK